MKNLNNLIITHGEDVDGLVSAGLVVAGRNHNTERRGEDFFLKPIFVENSCISRGFERVLRIVKKKEVDNVFVCDLSAGDKLLQGSDSILRQLAKQVGSVFWFDHHINTKKNLQKLEDAGIEKVFCRLDNEICTANIVVDFFGINQNRLLNFAMLARSHDCYPAVFDKKFYRFAGSFQYAISAVCYCEKEEERDNSFQEVFECIMKGDFLALSKWTHGKLSIYESQIFSAIREYYKSIVWEVVDFFPDKVIFAKASSMLPRKDTIRDIKEEYSSNNRAFDVNEVLGVCVIFDFPSRDVLFFSLEKTKFNASEFCLSLGGGGRGGDGGFSLSEEICDKGYEKIISFIKEALNNFLYLKKY